jgi:MSHA biogenesis protein MshP
MRTQGGFLMPLALFIVVGLGALAIAIGRLGSGSFSTAVQETLSVQAFYAAESGAQYAMHRLLFDAADSGEVDARCAAINGLNLNFSASGLGACSAQLICTPASNEGDNAGIYRLQSSASCGSGDLLAQRRISVAARYE